MHTTVVRAAVLGLAIAVGVTLSGLALTQTKPISPTVDAIKKRDQLICGTDTGIPGFAYQDNTGRWLGFDVDYCRAIAAAIVGDPEKIKFIGTTAKVRFTVLQSGEIDLLIRNSTLTFVRNNQLNLAEIAINFYAGQGFMVRKSLGVKTAKELNGATICMVTGATLELNIADFGKINNIKINSLLFERTEEAFAAAESGRCDGYTDDTGSLAAARSTMKNPNDWMVLAEVISKEPLGIHARQGDERYADMLKWVHYAIVTAEELGINKSNIDEMKKSSQDPFVRRLLGVEGDFGLMLGLDNDWAYRALKVTGNYGEVYDQYFGPKALDLPRGLNNLWNKGGLQYALPFR
jgi:general L-amino acid transport system substrate-binding protein